MDFEREKMLIISQVSTYWTQCLEDSSSSDFSCSSSLSYLDKITETEEFHSPTRKILTPKLSVRIPCSSKESQ